MQDRRFNLKINGLILNSNFEKHNKQDHESLPLGSSVICLGTNSGQLMS